MTEGVPGGARVAGDFRLNRVWPPGRPFWAGMLTLASGLVILAPPYATVHFGDIVVSLNTIGGVSSLLIGVVLVMCAVAMWIKPQVRVPVGIVAMLFALAAIVAANLGGFLIGSILGLIGGSLSIAWGPVVARPPEARGDQEVREQQADG